MTVPLLAGLGPWAGRYDAAILDSWGVLHDGIRPVPGVLDCMARLRDSGWKLAVASNAPRRAEPVAAQVEGFGVPRAAYDGIVTSGDLARTALRERSDPWHARLGRKFWHLGPERDHGLLDGLGFEQVDGPGLADFVLDTGLFDDETETAASYARFLERMLVRGQPMVCANPDVEVQRGERTIPCAGAIARAYEAMGGDVAYHGKPAPAAFEACVALLGVPRPRVLVVGDALATDIAGANRVGLDALFVTGGIHAAEFGRADAGADAVEAALARAGVVVVAAIPHLVW